MGAEWVRSKVDGGVAGRVALVAKDPGEARDVMIEGESGLLACVPPATHSLARKFRPKYEPSKKRMTWPDGQIATVYSSEEYDELRGPQHDLAWVDEPAKYRYLEQTLDNLFFGLRLGANPQAMFTTTPRPVLPLIKLMKDPISYVTHGTTYDNLANLAPAYQLLIRKYEGTRLGRQELNAEMLDDNPGALWSYAMLDRTRLIALPKGIEILRAVVGIDPSASEDGAEAGIIVGLRGSDGHGYLVQDCTLRGRPEAWAKAAVDAYHRWNADKIVGEVNNGGAMVEAVIRGVDRYVPFEAVSASRGKITRAEPISLLYEKGLIHHVGSFPELEDQMCTYDPLMVSAKMPSPDRMDAAVWTFTDLFGNDLADMRDSVFHTSKMASAREDMHL